MTTREEQLINEQARVEAQVRLAALRAKAKASGFVAPAPKNPAKLGQLAMVKVGWFHVHGYVVKIDGMFVWIESESKSYKVNALGCKYFNR
jgi:hypothetical protein